VGITVKDLARVAGVSTATVSRALRGFDSVDPETRQHVLDVARRLDYIASPAAAALSTGKAGAIGIITPFVDRLAFLRMLSGIEQEMRAANMDLLLYRTGDPSDPHPVPPHKRLARRVDGFLILSVAAESPDLEGILKLGMPLAMFGGAGPSASSVYVDDRAGAAAAMDHLIERGHRRIGIVYGREINNPIVLEHQRYLGCLDAMNRAELRVDDGLQVAGNYTIAGGKVAMEQLLALDEPPTAVFAFSDEMAFGAIQVMKDRNIRPGEDIAIIGYDGHEISGVLDLSTISVPFELAGATAARELLAELGNPSHRRTAQVLPTELIARATTLTSELVR
jgi:DNA-binding LacI/PurR family transcriptional regulator